MNKALYLIRIGELSLKKGNRGFFEKQLRRNIRKKIKPYSSSIRIQNGRFFLSSEDAPTEVIEQALSTTFGIVGYTRALEADKEQTAIREAAKIIADTVKKRKPASSFKVEARRADKSYPLSSYQQACDLGNTVGEHCPDFTVDVKNPDWVLGVEIRDKAYLYGDMHPAPGGLPYGSAGKGVVMLSGGIDSPVAAYLMAKRGLALEAVYFHAYPYTSDDALEKVKTLAKKIALFTGGIRLHVIPFTDAQLLIKRRGSAKELTLHMRAAMVQVANKVAADCGGKAIITGEALSQVASQTIDSITFTASFADFPIFRPLIGLDKEDIIRVARKIDTFETSILPYEDCCTIFSPDHPDVKPNCEMLRKEYEALEIEEEVEKAFANRRVVHF